MAGSLPRGMLTVVRELDGDTKHKRQRLGRGVGLQGKFPSRLHGKYFL